MSKRSYGQYCGLVRALEMVGERWAMIIVRDLFVGPKRFTDLRQGLGKIPSNILSTRLKELEENGIVQRRVLPRPDGSVVYELTPYGRELEPALVHLGRWGAKALGPRRDDEIVTPDSMVSAFRSTFREEHAKGVTARYEMHVGPHVFRLRVENGKLEEAAQGEMADADLVVETGAVLKALMAHELSPDEALAKKLVRVKGDRKLLGRFAEMFRI